MSVILLNDFYYNSIDSNNVGYEFNTIDKFKYFPIYSYNYKNLLFTDDSKLYKKYTLYLLLPFSFITDLVMFIPRKIINFIKNKYRRFKKNFFN